MADVRMAKLLVFVPSGQCFVFFQSRPYQGLCVASTRSICPEQECEQEYILNRLQKQVDKLASDKLSLQKVRTPMFILRNRRIIGLLPTRAVAARAADGAHALTSPCFPYIVDPLRLHHILTRFFWCGCHRASFAHCRRRQSFSGR